MTSFGLQNFTEIKNDSGHSNLSLLTIGLASLLGMSGYVFCKELFEPNLAIWESNVATVIIGSLVSTVIAYFILQRNRVLQKRVTAELIERQWTQEALADSEARYRQLFEANPQPMWVYDLETHEFLQVNEAAVRHYGYSHEEFARMTIKNVSLPREQTVSNHVNIKSLSPGYHTNRVWKHRKKNGALMDVEISSHNLDFGGKRAGLVLIHDVTEVKRVERILIESEAELRIMFGALNDIILVFDGDGRYLKVAPTNAKSRYKSPAELIGKTVEEIFPREQAEFMLRNIRLALEQKQMQNVEYKLEIGARTVWFEGRVSPMTNDTVFWISRDISERKEIEERMRESENRYRELFENATDIVYTIDLEGNFTSINKAGERLTGYSAEEVSQMNFAQLVLPEYHDIARRNMLKKVSGEVISGVYEVEIISKDGRRIPLETSTRLIEVDNAPTGLQGISRDITERRKLEEQLRESEKKFQDILGSMTEVVWSISTKDSTVSYVGPAVETIYGRPATEFWQDSKLWERVVHPEDTPTAKKFVLELHRDGRAQAEYRIIRPDKEVRWVNSRAQLISESNVPDPVRIDGITIDVTERKQLEEQLRQAQKLESVGQLAAGIAHEINTPLQYVGDNTRFLQDAFADLSLALEKHSALLSVARSGTAISSQVISEVEAAIKASDVEYLSKEIPASLGQSLEGIERVTRIVQSMKDFAHPGATEMKAVDLNKTIESTITVASNEWKYVADLETDFDLSLPPVVCMSGEINQVILNLIINAVHTISDVVGDGGRGKGKIVVQTKREGVDAVEVRISDTGKGIPEEVRDKIFNPFFTTKEVGRGTGQGLAISHRAITRHNGTLTFETELGRGTTFTICLPINNANLTAQTTSGGSSSSSSSGDNADLI